MAVRLREYVYSGRGHERRERAFRDKGPLLRRLRELMGGEPVFVDLVHEDEDTLTIGVGGPQACVMYVRGGGDPPYPWAPRAAGGDEPAMEFAACGTASPV